MKTGMNVRLAFVIFFFIFTYAGCNNSSEDKMLSKESPVGEDFESNNRLAKTSDLVTTSETKSVNLDNDVSLNITDRMLIRTGDIKIESDNFEEAESKILQIVKDNNGFVTNSTSQMNASGKRHGSITARVPSDKFDAFLNSLNSTGKVMSQNVSGQDVTSEFIDLSARQKTQKELESRLLDLLNNKTANLKDVVEVEEKLSSVREKIESTEGRMKFLKNQSAYSTLSISVFEPTLLQTSSGGGFFYEMKEAFKDGLEGFTGVFSFMITALISAIPLLIILGVIIFLLKKYIRSRKLKLQNT